MDCQKIIMLSLISMTFGGLRRDYFFRNLFIGSVFGVLTWLIIDMLEAKASVAKPLHEIVIMKGYVIFSSLLYPYAKFLYDYFWELLLGDRVYAYSINIFTVWFILVARLMCWFFAWALTPFGLIILYFKNR